MKPPYAVYLLVSEWSWDHTNREIATITIEGRAGHRYEKEYERIISEASPRELKQLASTFRQIAEAQGGTFTGSLHLVCLYRVIGWSGSLLSPSHVGLLHGQTRNISMALKPVCTFGASDTIIPSVH